MDKIWKKKKGGVKIAKITLQNNNLGIYDNNSKNANDNISNQ